MFLSDKKHARCYNKPVLSNSVFFCAVFHGLSNLLLSFFVIKINWMLIAELVIELAAALIVWYGDRKNQRQDN